MTKYTAEQITEAAKWIDNIAEAYHYPDEPWTQGSDMLRDYAALLRSREIEHMNQILERKLGVTIEIVERVYDILEEKSGHKHDRFAYPSEDDVRAALEAVWPVENSHGK